jgi:tetratricopeptide (TPR) repeat protein
MLEAVRNYAGEWLGAETLDELERRHSEYFRRLAQSLGREVDGPRSTEALARLARDDANLRLAVGWSIEHDDGATAVEFGPALGFAWFSRGDLTGCLELLETLVDGSEGADPGVRALTYLRMVWPALLSGDADGVRDALEQALALARAAADPALEGAALMAVGQSVLLGSGDIETAVSFYEQALAVPGSDEHAGHRLSAELGLAQALALADRPDGVGDLLARIEPVLRSHGDDTSLAHLLLDRSLVAWSEDDIEEILASAEEGCLRARTCGSTTWEQINLTALGTGHLERGEGDEAETALLRAARMALDDGNVMQLGVALQVLAALSAERGDQRVAARLLGAGLTLAPSWPLVERRLSRWLDRARDALGPEFDVEVNCGRALSASDAVAVAFGVQSPWPP